MSDSGNTLRFRCPHCSVVLKGRATDGGKQRRCPKCEKKFKIPSAKSKQKAAAVKETTAAPKVKPKPKTKKKKEELIPVICNICSTRMYAGTSQIGSSIECPDCFTQNLVKPPSKSAKKSAPRMDASMSYDIEPEQEIEVTKTLGEDLLAAADETVVKEIEEAPKGPDKPFIEGVYSFPFRLKVWPLLVGMIFSWTVLLVIIQFALSLPFILPVAAIVGALVLLPTLVTFQKIVENTSNADEDSECRPEGGILAIIEWVGETIPIGLAIFLSGLPTFLIIRVAQLPPESIVAVPIVAYVIFPLIYISMLESASAAGVFSKPVWGSLVKLPGTWAKFYSITALLLVIGLGVAGGLAYWRLQQTTAPPIGTMMAALTGAVAVNLVLLIIYFRLVGRVAYVLSQKIVVEDQFELSEEEQAKAAAGLDKEVSVIV